MKISRRFVESDFFRASNDNIKLNELPIFLNTMQQTINTIPTTKILTYFWTL